MTGGAGTADQPEVHRLLLEPDGLWPTGTGPSSALYVMVTADGTAAKVGACERVDRVEGRLREVEKKQRTRIEDPAAYPIRLVIVAELKGLVVSGEDGWEMWSITTHLETAMRLVIARRLGHLSGWADWLHLEQQLDAAELRSAFLAAWTEVAALGRDIPEGHTDESAYVGREDLHAGGTSRPH